MAEQIHALFSNVPAQREQVQRMLLDAGLIDSLVESPPDQLLYRIELPDEETAQRLLVAAKLHGLPEPMIRRTLRLTKKELAAAPLLVLSAGGPGAGVRHPRKDTTYDDQQACPECGAGLVQTSSFRLRKTELPKSYTAAGIGDELLLHESVAEPVAAARLRGVGFREVEGQKSETLPWRQVVIEATMPAMLAGSRGLIRGRSGLERPCARCGRDGWFNTGSEPFVPAYSEAAIATMPDAAWAQELFSTGAWATPVNGKRWLAGRYLIVRPAVYALFTRLKVKGVRWSPVVVQG